MTARIVVSHELLAAGCLGSWRRFHEKLKQIHLVDKIPSRAYASCEKDVPQPGMT